ncbi:MAG: hypothetical protein AAF222_03320 [Pseudomonadota bacterium]
MSEFARLEEKLAKLRHRERIPGEGRKLRGTGPDALLAAIVTEIDETILPRRLTFEVPGGHIHLAVANRRLQALLGPAPASIPDGLVGLKLPDVEEPAVAKLGAALKTVLAEAEAVGVSAIRLTETFGSDIGVPAEQLPRVWSVKASKTLSASETLEAFLVRLDTKSVAWLRIEGEEVTGQGGPEAIVSGLAEQAALFLDGYFSKFETAFRESSLACGTLISPGDAAQTGLFFIEIDTVSAILSAPTSEILGIATAWQRLVAE